MKQEPQPNVRTIERFMGQISADWEAGEKFEVRFLGQHRTPTTSQFGTHAFDEMIEHITAMNLSGLNCYSVINPVPNEAPRNVCDEHIQMAYFAFVDADEKGVAFKCRDFDRVTPHMHVITGTRPWIRCHTYYRLDPPMENMSDWRQVQKNLIGWLGTDKGIHNPSRIMRIAGTVSYPDRAKQLKGYKVERTRLKIGDHYV